MKKNFYSYQWQGLLILFLIFSIQPAFSQTRTVSGKVIDAKTNETLVGVTIRIKGSQVSTATDAQGNFKITAPVTATVTASFIGYTTAEVTAATSPLLIKLTGNEQSLSEVVVVGFGTQKKATLTGAIAQVGEEVFKDRSVPNPALALQGEIPGLTVTRTSSRPGNEALKIRLRGESSVAAVDPLLIIDGVPATSLDELSLINPNDIATTTVLKDASAAIYGARAQDGVILITTKRGRGKMQFNFNSNARLTTVGATVPWGDMQQWATMYLAASTADKRDASGNPVDFFPQWQKETLIQMAAGQQDIDFTDSKGNVRHYQNNNWQNALYAPSWSNQQNLSVRGASDRSAYLLSLGYSDDRSLLKTAYDGEKKYNLRMNYDYDLSKKIKLQTGLSYNNRNVTNPSHGVNDGYYDAPIFPAYNLQGQYYDDYGYRNPVAFTEAGGTTSASTGALALNSTLTADLLPGLKFTGQGAFTRTNTWKTAYDQTFYFYNWLGTQITAPEYAPPNGPSISETIGASTYQTYLAQLNYNKTFAIRHHFSAMIANSAELYQTKQIGATRAQLLYDGLYDINTAISPSAYDYTKSNSGNSSHWGLISYISRLNYDYEGKYLIELLGRRDGSSKFNDVNRWSNFYGISGGWRISQEKFMKPLTFVNDLKLRASYGETGGQAGIGNYDYVSNITTGTTLLGTTPALQNTSVIGGITTTNRTWERMVNKNLGLDFTLFNNQLTGYAELYEKRNIGMLIALVYPSILGGTAPVTNNGTFRTRGWEFNVNWTGSLHAFKYNVGFNLSNDQNLVTSYSGKDVYAAGKNAVRQGYPLNSLFLFKTDGYFQSQADADAYFKKYGSGGIVGGYTSGTKVLRGGDLRVVDLDGDGLITQTGNGTPGSGDLFYYGDANPHYSFGLNLGGQYKGFDFSAFVQGVGKWNILRAGSARAPFYKNYMDINTTYIGQTWTPDNPNAKYPRLSFEGSINSWNWDANDVNVQNLRYARLKSLIVGYALPPAISHKLSLERIRFYFSGTDLFTISSVKDGFDPERGESADSSFPFTKVYSFGLDVTF